MPVALITGGSRGFGRALAIDLAMDGWALVIDGRDRSALEQTADHLIGLGAHTVAIAGDVADPARTPLDQHSPVSLEIRAIHDSQVRWDDGER